MTVDADDRAEAAQGEGTSLPGVVVVPLAAPFGWLARGLADMRAAPWASLFYGLAFAAMGWALSLVFEHATEYTTTLAMGFFLVGPFLATGLYDLSRRIARGEPGHLGPTLSAFSANAGAIGIYVLILTVVMLVWARASLVTFALFFSTGMPTLDKFFAQVVSLAHIDFVATYFFVGGFFALLVFALSVVSMPMMLDRGAETVASIFTSVRVIVANPGPMLLWATLIVALIGVGFATLFLGLIVTGPLLGHATWHAYRQTVAPVEAADG